MDKLKKMFKGEDKPASSSTGGSSQAATTEGVNADKVVLHTNVGDITIELYSDKTPKVNYYNNAPKLGMY